MIDLAFFLKQYFQVQDEQISSISSLFDIVILRKDECLLETNKYCKHLAFVQQGIIRISALYEGKDVTQWIATEGGFVTDLQSFIFNKPARWNISAVTDTTLFAISKTNYDKISTIIPNWHNIEREFLTHCFTNTENRIFQFISMTAEERYYEFYQQNKYLFNLVPLHYIASVLGMTPETLSRIRRKSIS